MKALEADRALERTAWHAQLEEWRALYPYKYRRAEGVLKPQTVLETLRDMTAGRDDVIWTTGVGQHQMWAMQYLQCDRPRTFITSGGLGTMGYGLPGRGRREGRAARTRPSSASTATAASR